MDVVENYRHAIRECQHRPNRKTATALRIAECKYKSLRKRELRSVSYKQTAIETGTIAGVAVTAAQAQAESIDKQETLF